MTRRCIKLTLDFAGRPLVLYEEQRGRVSHLHGKAVTLPTQRELAEWVREGRLPGDVSHGR